MPQKLYPWGNSPIPIGYEAGWTPRPGLDVVAKRRKSLPLPGISRRKYRGN